MYVFYCLARTFLTGSFLLVARVFILYLFLYYFYFSGFVVCLLAFFVWWVLTIFCLISRFFCFSQNSQTHCHRNSQRWHLFYDRFLLFAFCELLIFIFFLFFFSPLFVIYPSPRRIWIRNRLFSRAGSGGRIICSWPAAGFLSAEQFRGSLAGGKSESGKRS